MGTSRRITGGGRNCVGEYPTWTSWNIMMIDVRMKKWTRLFDIPVPFEESIHILNTLFILNSLSRTINDF